jgi:hypothetical protein
MVLMEFFLNLVMMLIITQNNLQLQVKLVKKLWKKSRRKFYNKQCQMLIIIFKTKIMIIPV